MSGLLHLTISTPARVLVSSVPCVSVRAEDETGGFGLLPGHADFLTVLPASVVSWKGRDGSGGACALSGGMLTVVDGEVVSIACRRGVTGDSVAALPVDVLRQFEAEDDEGRRARVEQTRLHAEAVRQLMRYLRGTDGASGSLAPRPGEPS